MEDFIKGPNGFNFNYDNLIQPNTELLLKMPSVSANKRGINDIGFTAEDGITLYATLSAKPRSASAVWQEIQPFDEINKTTSFIKIVNNQDSAKRVNIRVIMC